jgi:hypothetical protein
MRLLCSIMIRDHELELVSWGATKGELTAEILAVAVQSVIRTKSFAGSALRAAADFTWAENMIQYAARTANFDLKRRAGTCKDGSGLRLDRCRGSGAFE